MVMIMQKYIPPASPAMQSFKDALSQYSGRQVDPATSGYIAKGDTLTGPDSGGPEMYDVNTILKMAPRIAELRAAAEAGIDPQAEQSYPIGHMYGSYGNNPLGLTNWKALHPHGASFREYLQPATIAEGSYSPEGVAAQWQGLANVKTPQDVYDYENAKRKERYDAETSDGGFFGILTDMLPAIAMGAATAGVGTGLGGALGVLNAGNAALHGNIPGAIVSGLGGAMGLNDAGTVAGATGNLGFTSGWSPGSVLSNATGLPTNIANQVASAGMAGITGGAAGMVGSAIGSGLTDLFTQNGVSPQIASTVARATQAGIAGGKQGIANSLTQAGINATVNGAGISTGNQAIDGVINGLLKGSLSRAVS